MHVVYLDIDLPFLIIAQDVSFNITALFIGVFVYFMDKKCVYCTERNCHTWELIARVSGNKPNIYFSLTY